MNGKSRRREDVNEGWSREIGGEPIAQDRWTPSLVGLIALIIIVIILFLMGME